MVVHNIETVEQTVLVLGQEIDVDDCWKGDERNTMPLVEFSGTELRLKTTNQPKKTNVSWLGGCNDRTAQENNKKNSLYILFLFLFFTGVVRNNNIKQNCIKNWVYWRFEYTSESNQQNKEQVCSLINTYGN